MTSIRPLVATALLLLLGQPASCTATGSQRGGEASSKSASVVTADTQKASKALRAKDPSEICKGKNGATYCKRSAALLSAYTHALGDPADISVIASVMPLADAGRALYELAQLGEPDEIRRRYAIMRTVVGGLALEQSECLSEEAVVFLKSTKAPLLEIRTEIEKQLRVLVPGSSKCGPAPGREFEVLPPEIIELLIRRLQTSLFALGAWSPLTCEFEPIDEPAPGTAEVCSGSDPAATSAAVVAKSYISVNQNYDVMRVLFDPQNWDAAGGCATYFELCCAIGADENCKKCPPAAGSLWSGLLYENFVIHWDQVGPFPPSSSDFGVILDTKSKPSINRYRVDYCLDDVKHANIGNNESGTITIDQGYAEIQYVSDTTSRIEVVKRILFEGWTDVQTGQPIDQSVNYMAKFMLTALADSTAAHACCKAPSDPSCGSTLGAPILLSP